MGSLSVMAKESYYRSAGWGGAIEKNEKDWLIPNEEGKRGCAMERASSSEGVKKGGKKG